MTKWSSSFCLQISPRAGRLVEMTLRVRLVEMTGMSFRAKPAGRSREICHPSGASVRFLVEQILFKALNGKALRLLSPEMRLVL